MLADVIAHGRRNQDRDLPLTYAATNAELTRLFWEAVRSAEPVFDETVVTREKRTQDPAIVAAYAPMYNQARRTGFRNDFRGMRFRTDDAFVEFWFGARCERCGYEPWGEGIDYMAVFDQLVRHRSGRSIGPEGTYPRSSIPESVHLRNRTVLPYRVVVSRVDPAYEAALARPVIIHEEPVPLRALIETNVPWDFARSVCQAHAREEYCLADEFRERRHGYPDRPHTYAERMNSRYGGAIPPFDENRIFLALTSDMQRWPAR